MGLAAARLLSALAGLSALAFLGMVFAGIPARVEAALERLPVPLALAVLYLPMILGGAALLAWAFLARDVRRRERWIPIAGGAGVVAPMVPGLLYLGLGLSQALFGG